MHTQGLLSLSNGCSPTALIAASLLGAALVLGVVLAPLVVSLLRVVSAPSAASVLAVVSLLREVWAFLVASAHAAVSALCDPLTFRVFG
jgi:hypothetical protein